MHLKALSIHGFKSFAKKAELEFDTPITAIVGPNGSGKSNVAEAFRFVLGEQSIKSLRGKRGEDLIFNGSEQSARANRAAVTITLDNVERNGKRTFPLDFDEITIERVVLRDGTNEYSINGSRTRLKDVTELLAVANIGPTGHHIISQGEADRILSATARERREMIEDALGLKVYQYKKIESERKLKKTRENIAQVESLRREVLPHFKFLERQVKKLEKALVLQGELTAAYAEYLKREDIYIAHHHDRLTAARREQHAQFEKLAQTKEAAEKNMHIEEAPEEKKQCDALSTDIASTRAAIQEKNRTLGQVEGQITYLEQRMKRSEERPAPTSNHAIPFDVFEQASTAIERAVATALQKDDVGLLKRALRDIMHILKRLTQGAATTETADTKKEDQAEHAALLKKKETLQEELTELTAQEAAQVAEHTKLTTELAAFSREQQEAERTVFKIANEQSLLEQELARIDAELSILERDRAEFKRELQEAVSLLGSGATSYFKEEVLIDGTPLTTEVIIAEDRTKQYERRRTLEKMKIRLEELGTGSNEDVLKEYKDVQERDAFLAREIDDLETSAKKLESLIGELATELNTRFEMGIEKIDAEFTRFFTLMFGGGAAQLVRVKQKRKKDDDVAPTGEEEADAQSENEEGIDIDVKLPNKRVRGLDMLSGGERALTSIALIFAMSQVNPPLFVILDETDAALDEANSRRYGDMITALSERSQLILITHNRETMSRAGILYGVTMSGDGVSKLLSIKFDDAVTVAK